MASGTINDYQETTHEEITGVTFNDLDPSGTPILSSSEFSIVNGTEIALNIPHKSAYFMN